MKILIKKIGFKSPHPPFVKGGKEGFIIFSAMGGKISTTSIQSAGENNLFSN
jgi:hypothetical protein